MRISTVVAWLIGVALLAGLVALNDAGRVLDAVAALRGWLALAIAFHAVPLFFDAAAWRCLFAAPPRFGTLFGIRWIAEGVNGLFPVPHLGELLRADLVRRRTGSGEGGASVVVDVTLGVGTQVLFTLLGLALLARLAEGGALLQALLIAAAVLAGCAITFYLLPRAGLFALTAAIVRRWPGPARRLVDIDDARALDDRVRAVYGRRRELATSGLWRLLGWTAGAGETWLVLYGLGHPVSFADAVMLESLSQAARTAAFAIPGGLGVQDGALLLLSAQLGLGAETGLALALAKRCRELAIGLPGLATGYIIEARRLAAAGGWRGEPPSA
jgi:putative membrane protein